MSKATDQTQCGDTRTVMGVYNQGEDAIGYPIGDGKPCSESTTHTLNGKPLCHKHWVQGLEARKAAERRGQSYSNQLRNYQR